MRLSMLNIWKLRASKRLIKRKLKYNKDDKMKISLDEKPPVFNSTCNFSLLYEEEFIQWLKIRYSRMTCINMVSKLRHIIKNYGFINYDDLEKLLWDKYIHREITNSMKSQLLRSYRLYQEFLSQIKI